MRFVVEFRMGDLPTTNRYRHAVLVQDNWDDTLDPYLPKERYPKVLGFSEEPRPELRHVQHVQT